MTHRKTTATLAAVNGSLDLARQALGHTREAMTRRYLDPRFCGRSLAGVLLSRCTLCGRYEVGQPLGACAVCGGRRRLATVGELFEGDGDDQDAGGTRPPAMDRHDAG